MRLARSLALGVLVVSATAGATDVSGLYEVITEGTSTTTEAGKTATLSIAIVTREGAHVSDEAPLRIELSGTNAQPAQQRLTLANSLEQKPAGQKYPKPRFQVSYTAGAPGKATMDAKMVFFICTEDVCARQTKTLSFPLEVTSATKAL